MSPPPHTRTKTLLMSVLIILWIGGSLGGLWWFQQQATRPFSDTEDTASSRSLNAMQQAFSQLNDQLSGNRNDNRITLFHLWNPDCLCNNVSQRHINRILDAFPEDQLRLVVIAPQNVSMDAIAALKTQTPRAEVFPLSAATDIPLSASPGLAVFNTQDTLAYYGAYGFGALCSLSQDNMFTDMITALLAGESYGPFMNIAGRGCFCAWPHPE